MKRLMLAFTGLLCLTSCQTNKEQNPSPHFVTDDIDHFWTAYDQIIATEDSTLQLDYLHILFLAKGSPGLKAIMEKKGYTADDYLEAIRNYPLFWASIRDNTLQAKVFAREIEREIQQLKAWYPELKPADIYFTVGALGTGGTILDSLVLIGSEIALADSTVVTHEFPDWFRTNLRTYFDSNPIRDVVLLNVHEYVHTQQNRYGYDLLSQSLFEGVAEFVSVQAAGKASVVPAVSYGKAHEEQVKERFAKEMFSPNWNDWLYNNFENEFQVRDLGYYVGYAICEKYYELAIDKKTAIKAMIELDYGNPKAVEGFVQTSGYFSKSIQTLKAQYEQSIPEVIKIKEFQNGDQAVDPALDRITIEFSAGMSKRFRNFRFGPLGADYVLPLKNFIGFSADGRSITYELELTPGRRYQLLVSDEFRTVDGVALRPYLIDFKTDEN